MKTLQFHEVGEAAEVLALADRARPRPGKGELLLRVLGSPIHPADLFFIRGTYRLRPVFPQTAGLEGAGIVEEAGPGTRTPAGTLCAFLSLNAWAEYTLVREEALLPLPPAFPPEKAVQACLNPFTAWGLLERAGATPGRWLLLTAAGSALAGIVIQLARRRGIPVIAVVRDLAQAPGLQALGADAVLDAAAPDFEERVREITGGEGVHAALEAVGGDTGTRTIAVMGDQGRVLIYGMMDSAPVRFNNAQIVYNNLELVHFGIRAYLDGQTPAEREAMRGALLSLLEDEALVMPVEGSFPLEAYREALAAHAQRGRRGKILFRLSS